MCVVLCVQSARGTRSPAARPASRTPAWARLAPLGRQTARRAGRGIPEPSPTHTHTPHRHTHTHTFVPHPLSPTHPTGTYTLCLTPTLSHTKSHLTHLLTQMYNLTRSQSIAPHPPSCIHPSCSHHPSHPCPVTHALPTRILITPPPAHMNHANRQHVKQEELSIALLVHYTLHTPPTQPHTPPSHTQPS